MWKFPLLRTCMHGYACMACQSNVLFLLTNNSLHVARFDLFELINVRTYVGNAQTTDRCTTYVVDYHVRNVYIYSL